MDASGLGAVFCLRGMFVGLGRGAVAGAISAAWMMLRTVRADISLALGRLFVTHVNCSEVTLKLASAQNRHRRGRMGMGLETNTAGVIVWGGVEVEVCVGCMTWMLSCM